MTNPGAAQAKDRSDLSQFLIHLTKDGVYEDYQLVVGSPPGYQAVRKPVRAKQALIDILSSKSLVARSPFGYFRLKVDMYRPLFGRAFINGGVDPGLLTAVCFSETPLRELSSFYRAVSNKKNAYKKYGLAFHQENVRNAGGNPIFYIDSRKADFKSAVETSNSLNPKGFEPLLPFMETFGPLHLSAASGWSDFRWEREWRKKGDFNFDWVDVAFGICPANEIPNFELLTNNQVTFLDPDWDELTLERYLQIKNPLLFSTI